MNLPARQQADEAQITTVLVVPGMHCAGCMAKVERGLTALDGVTSARVNLTARQVRVDHDPALGIPVLVEALQDVGFASQPRGEDLAPPPSAVKPLLPPLAVAGFACMNVMLLSVSIWSGAEGATKELFHWLSAAIGVPVSPALAKWAAGRGSYDKAEVCTQLAGYGPACAGVLQCERRGTAPPLNMCSGRRPVAFQDQRSDGDRSGQIRLRQGTSASRSFPAGH